MLRYSSGKIIKKMGHQIGDSLVIVADTMAIRETVGMAIHIGTPQVMVESDP